MKYFTLGAVCAGILTALSGTAHAIAVSGQGTWESTLQGRDLDGDLSTFEAYYDTALDITWLADANYAYTSGFDSNGMMNWITANAWAAGLDPYGSGISGWRLPTVTDTGSSGCTFAYTGTDCGYNVDTATGEMAHMFYTTLGDNALFDTSGNFQADYGLTNTGPFSNVQSNYYWSATDYAPYYPRGSWYFIMGYGLQLYTYKTVTLYAWAVHTGDVGVSAVPVPAAVWLFGSGLLGLVGVSSKRRR